MRAGAGGTPGRLTFNDRTPVCLVSECPLDFCLRELQAVGLFVVKLMRRHSRSHLLYCPMVGRQRGPSVPNYLPSRASPHLPHPSQLRLLSLFPRPTWRTTNEENGLAGVLFLLALR